MHGLRFEWHAAKNAENRRKHGVGFEEARTAFLDEQARVIHDPAHSRDEDRFILLGLSAHLRLLVVCHVYREDEQVIRLISARRASPTERRQYARLLR